MTTLIRLAVATLAAAFVFMAPVQGAELTADEKSAIESVVRDYILNNPEIVQEALVALEKKKQDQESAAAKAAITEMRDLIYSSKRQAVLGDPSAPITLVEFFDYNCGYCKRALSDTIAMLDADKDVKIVMKEFPILGPGSVEAARVAIAVQLLAPDRYFDFHKTLLTEKGQADGKRALAAVEEIGLDPAAVRAKMEDPEVNATLNEVYGIAQRLGLTGTPTYVLADEVVFGAVGVDELRAKIAAVRECGKVTC
jgi:protein-disulfide isomerase